MAKGPSPQRLETDRLILRRWRDEDRAPFASMNADPRVMEHFASAMTPEQSDALIDRIEALFETKGFGLFALERKEDQAFLGFTGLAPALSGAPVSGDIEIGWRLAPEYWRRGYAFEAASACARWFWDNTDGARLVSYTAKTNIPSRSLMSKLGFERRADLDFDHPSIAPDNPVCHQVVYVRQRP